MKQTYYLLWMIAVSLSAAVAHPAYFHERNIAKTCNEHPSKTLGGHLTPVTDTNITVLVTKRGQPYKEVCPGENYTLSVTFGGEARAALVTVSGGTLRSANVASCANAMSTNGSSQVTKLKSRWTVPCSLLGRVEVKVTSATSATGAFHKNSAGFTILPVSRCPGYNRCKADSQNPTDAAAAAPNSNDSNNAPPSAAFPAPPKINSSALKHKAGGSNGHAAAGAPGPLFFAANEPVALGGSSSGALLGLNRAGRMCNPSNLGYQCSGVVSHGVVVHYSYGGMPPMNICTNKTALDRGLKNSTNLMHFAIETEQQGFVSLGFPLAPGRMVPADAVLGRLDNATGAVKVNSYRLTAVNSEGVKVMPGWATAVGGARRVKAPSSSSSSGNVMMVVCFSRPTTARTSIVPNLDPSMVPIIWASHSKDSFSEKHDKHGSLIVNMLSGQHAVLNHYDKTAVRPKYIAHIAHGAAMAAAFCLLMPAAGLLARHRWIFTPADEPFNPNAGGPWMAFHFFIQLLSGAGVLVCYVLAMLMWFKKHNLGFDRHILYAPHCELGSGVAAMVAVQLLAGLLRACLPERHWSAWRTMHTMWGWATVAAGAANCVLGTFLMRDLLGMPWLLWLLPVACSLGGLMLAGMSLEIPRMHRVRQSCGWDEDARSDTTASTIRSKTALSISGRTATTDDLPVTPRPGRVLSPRLSDAPAQVKTA